MNSKLANFGLFQSTYFACVLGAANGHPWLGALAAIPLLALNLWFIPRTKWVDELRLWATCGAIGCAVDSALFATGPIGFPSATLPGHGVGIWSVLAPPWIVALWIAVGSTLNGSLDWLHGRLRLAALLGAVGGPLSFWSGARLNATELPLGPWSFLALSVEYAVVFPILVHLSAGRGEPLAPSIDAP